MIPAIIRQTHEATADALDGLRAFLTALDYLNAATPHAEPGTPETDAICIMIDEARARLVQIEELRNVEWAAIRNEFEK